MDPIIKKNIALMQSAGKGGMQRLLMGESMGGNAGSYNGGRKKYTCTAANMAIDGTTGEIAFFANPQDLPRMCLDSRRYPTGTFRIAINFSSAPHLCVLEFVPDRGRLSGSAERIVRLTIAEYNQVYGFRPE